MARPDRGVDHCPMNRTTAIRRTRTAAFVFLSALLMVTASERVYWYLGGANLESIFAIAGFYVLPTLAALWAIGSGPSNRLHQMILAGAIFGFVVEGVLTPVIYEDGPLPVMAALFVGWHGLFSVVGFWYLTRRWLLAGRRRLLAASATAMGAYWGVWSLGYRLPSAFEDFEEPFEVMGPGDFAVYALTVGGVFALGHYLIGFVWPERFAPGKWGRRSIALLLLGYGALAVLPVVPWAPVKFAILVGGSVWLLRRSRGATPGEPTAIEALQGHASPRDFALLMLMPVAAAVSYAVGWSFDPGDTLVEGIFTTFSIGQVIAGLVAFVWAARRSLRRTNQEPAFSNVE